MDIETFRRAAHDMVEWMARYRAGVASYPVKSPVSPGEIAARVPARAPAEAEPFERLVEDFERVILPGMTHWQHPRFFAYFPSNASLPSVLAEMLTATMGAQCMSWVTSPAATELEQRMMEWLADAFGLGPAFTGSIQDAASVSTLVAVLTARERASGFATNEDGLYGGAPFVVYCSEEAHSSVEKAVKVAGLGRKHLRKIPVDGDQAMRIDLLEAAILRDQSEGLRPLMIVAALGTTATVAVDPLDAAADVAARHGLWLHVDAAYAGAALLLPEYADLARAAARADSVVVNAHKWLFTNFDCSVYFVRSPGDLVRTFELLPEYLKTSEGSRVVNYRDWSICLGRRFRALKLWFVLRTYGLDGLRERLRAHIALAGDFARRVEADPRFELTTRPRFNLVCFRYRPDGVTDAARLDALNLALLEALNARGKVYLSHARVRGEVTLRLVAAQTDVTADDIALAWDEITRAAAALGAG
jgi:aromatic-L-amino-acid/L-tryptophan decarboxylase